MPFSGAFSQYVGILLPPNCRQFGSNKLTKNSRWVWMFLELTVLNRTRSQEGTSGFCTSKSTDKISLSGGFKTERIGPHAFIQEGQLWSQQLLSFLPKEPWLLSLPHKFSNSLRTQVAEKWMNEWMNEWMKNNLHRWSVYLTHSMFSVHFEETAGDNGWESSLCSWEACLGILPLTDVWPWAGPFITPCLGFHLCHHGLVIQPNS